MASLHGRVLFFFNDTATTEIFPLSLHDALPISRPDASLTSANSATAAVSCSRSRPDRKSTRLNSSHVEISYAVFCLKKKACLVGENRLSDQRDASINLPLIAAIVGGATIGGFMFGYDSGVINGTQEGLKSTFNLSEAWLGVTVSALLPGCAVGAFAAGRSADLWGRRRVMVAAAILFILSALAAGAAASALMMIIARFAAGVGVGAASVLSPAYFSEVTPASMGGRLSSVQQVMIIAGLTGAFLGK